MPPPRAPSPSPPSSRWRPLLPHAAAALAVAAAILLAYGGSLENGFTLDSELVVRRAPRVQAATWANVVDILTTDYWWPVSVTGTHRPLTTLSYLFNWAVLGNADRPAGYHAVNLGLHFLNAMLVYALALGALGVAATTAFLAALLFATHPIATEAVTNIVGRADLLATAAVLGGLVAYTRAVASASAARRRTGLAVVASIAALGLLSKESAVVLVPAIALYDLLYRLPRSAGARPLERFRALVRDWLWLAPPLVAIGLFRVWIFRDRPATEIDFAQNILAAVDPWIARLTALKVIARALVLLVWPARLCPDYSVNEIPVFAWSLAAGDAQAGLALVVIAIAVAAAVALRRRAPAAAFSIGFFLLALLPTANLLFSVGTVFGERFLYLPLAPFSTLVAIAFAAAALRVAGLASAEPAAKARWATLVLLVVVAAGFALRSARRNLDWRDDVSLWQAATEVCPASYKSWQGLATALAALPAGDPRAGGIDRVVELQEHAVDILERNAPPDAPFPAFVLERLGLFLLEKTRAVARQESAGEVPAGTSAIWASKAADALGRAVEEYDRETARRRASASGAGDVLEIGTLRVHLDHGAALLQLGRNEEALVAFQRARRLVPISAEAHLDVSAAHAALGRDEEALIATLQALLVESQRTDLQARIFALYQRVDPGGCGFTREGGQVVVHPDCPAAHRLVCRAYAELLRTLASASNVPLAEREAAIARYRKGAEDGFRCAALDAPPGA